MTNPRRIVTRKEIAAHVGVSEETVTRRQRDWGLDKCASVATKRPTVFFREATSKALIERRVTDKPL